MGLSVNMAHAQDSDNFSLEDLMQVEVVSSNKFSQELSDIPAAVFIINKEDIARSHASNLPELLVTVPGLFVAQASSNSWAIGSRGFSGVFANKLLVMVDGRSLFSPLFSGVFWDMLDIYLDDIERIEVIRGAGSSVWGANAINGVINIITKSTIDTQTSHLYSKIGKELEHDIGLRQGFEISEGIFGRLYAKQKKFASNHFDLADIYDSWRSTAIGGRLDGFSGDDSWYFSADYVDQKTADIGILDVASQSLVNKMKNTSWNVSTSWQRIVTPENQFSLSIQLQEQQRYGQSYRLQDKMLNSEFDHSLTLTDNWHLNYGAGYRRHNIDISSPSTFVGLEQEQQQRAEIYSGYGQVSISLDKSQSIKIGSKVEQHQQIQPHVKHHGHEIYKFKKRYWLPNVRYINKINDDSSFWLSINKSSRVPSITERGLNISFFTIPAFTTENPGPWPIETRFFANPNFVAEEIISAEMGFRANVNQSFNFDLSLFYSDFDNLRTTAFFGYHCEKTSLAPPACAMPDTIINSLKFDNLSSARSYGIESYANWLVNQALNIKFNYSFLNINNSASVDNVAIETANQTFYRHTLVTTLDWQFNDRFNMHFNAIYRGALQQGIGAVEQLESEIKQLNINFNYQLTEYIEIFLQVNDIFNDKKNLWFAEYPTGHVSTVNKQGILGFRAIF